MLQSSYLTLITVWIIFSFLHSGLASGVAIRVAQKIMGSSYKFYRAMYSFIILITLIFLFHYHSAAVGTILWRPHWLIKIVAIIFILSGFAVIVVSIWKNFLSLSGIGVLLGVETPVVFQENGLHQYMRHPMYTGTLVFIWGVFLGYPYMNNLVSAVCLTLYTFIGIYFLEKKLVVVYGEQYKEYQSRVPKLLPLARHKKID
jgi:protein-S-isoprenylcysteine O-methyltransferase Ste14